MNKIELNFEKYELIHGDCFKFLKEIPDNSIDLILTDPPYNLGKYSTGNINLPWRTEINNNLEQWDEITLEPKYLADDFIRILKPTGNIFIFCSYNLIGKYHEVFDRKFDTFQYMVWHKTNPTPKIYKAGFLNSCELICCMWNKKHTWNFLSQKEMHNFIETPICMGSERLKNPKHPTQKPLKVMKHIINIASNYNDMVLDPFMGVGSTGIAAVEMGRKFLGIEKEKKYYEASKHRFSSGVQVSLFNKEK